jgi:putative DNA primase/helicase
VVLSATEEYLEGEDALGRWIADRCVMRSNATVFSKDLYQDWIKWCQETGEKAGLGYSQKRFSQALKTRGLTIWRDTASGLRGFRGIELLVGDYDAVSEFSGTNVIPF